MNSIKQIIKQLISATANLIPIRTRLSPLAARDTLSCFSSKPTGTCYTSNVINLQYDLQIIIPCYNVEKWVKRCLESVLNQRTKYNILVSIVNDGSTDGTENVIRGVMERYSCARCSSDFSHATKPKPQCSEAVEQQWYVAVPGRGGYTIELKNQENQGFSGARNTALKEIKGTYVTFLDSDDVVEKGSIDTMLDVAFKSNAEILQGGWYEFNDDGLRKEKIVNTLSGFPWGKLYKYNVIEHFQFPEGFWFEDTPLSFILAALPYKTEVIQDIVYGYRLNPEGISATAGKKKRSVESYWITEECLEEFEKFSVKYDQRAYEYLLRQSITNGCRVRHQPKRIREAIFVLTEGLMEKYFLGFRIEVDEMKKIEKALRKRQFVKFDLLILGK